MLAQMLTCLAALLSALLAIIASSPLATPAVCLIAYSFSRVVKRYRPSAAEAKRLVAVLHGPVVALLLESIGGREYVRALGRNTMFEQHALALLEVSTRAQVLNIGLQRWLALQLEYLGALMLLCVAMLTVACRSSSALGLSGLALTYALTLTALGKYLVNYAARADAQVRTR